MLSLGSAVVSMAQSLDLQLTDVSDPSNCTQVSELVQEGDFNRAASLVAHTSGLRNCESTDFLRALAKLKAAFFEFAEAEKILLPLAEKYPNNEEIQREWNHMVNLKTDLGAFQPVAISPLKNIGEKQNIKIAWMEDSIPKIVNEQPGPTTYYPIKRQGRSYTTFQPEDLLAKPVLAVIKKKLEESGYEDIHGMVALADGSMIISVVKTQPYSNKDDAYRDELVYFNTDGKLKGKLPFMDCACNNAFPSYNSTDQTLYFSSDREGGLGGMDIWKMKLNGDDWSAPVNLGMVVNTSAHELMPTCSGDTLFFSSNVPYAGFGGFDLYAYDISQETKKNLGLPINGPYDDFGFQVIRPGEAIWLTNRNSEHVSNQIFRASWTVPENFFDKLKGHVKSTSSLSGKEVLLLNDYGDVIDRVLVDAKNNFEFKHIKGNDTYRIEISDAKLDASSSLQLFDSEDKMISEIAATSNNGFVFELLTPQDYYITEMANLDESILSLNISGKVDKGGGFKIVLLNSDGDEIATTYTSMSGQFKFASVSADDRYTFKSEVADGNSPVYILNEKGEIIQTIEPGADGGYAYVRLSANDGVITLTNEYKKRVRISQKDLFALGVVNYEFNSAEIPKSGAEILDGLAEILQANPQVRIELEGHTDSKGSDLFNLELSQKRIASAITYLRSHGISANRLSGKGYGESRPLTACPNEDDCDEFDHAINRRIAFRLIDMLESNLAN